MPNRNSPEEKAKILADSHRLKAIKQQLHMFAQQTPDPTLKRIALNAKKEIRL